MTTLAIWAPALLLVGPGPIIASLLWAERLHDWAGWSLAGVLQWIGGEQLPSWPFAITRWAGGLLTVSLVLLDAGRRRRAALPWGVFLAGGLAVFLVVLYAGYWSTHGYLAQVAPILCWELDELAGARSGQAPAPRRGSRSRPAAAPGSLRSASAERAR